MVRKQQQKKTKQKKELRLQLEINKENNSNKVPMNSYRQSTHTQNSAMNLYECIKVIVVEKTKDEQRFAAEYCHSLCNQLAIFQ